MGLNLWQQADVALTPNEKKRRELEERYGAENAEAVAEREARTSGYKQKTEADAAAEAQAAFERNLDSKDPAAVKELMAERQREDDYYESVNAKLKRHRGKPTFGSNKLVDTEVGGFDAVADLVPQAIAGVGKAIGDRWDKSQADWKRRKQGLNPLSTGAEAGPPKEFAIPPLVAASKPADKPKTAGSTAPRGTGGGGAGGGSSKPTGGEMTDAALTMEVADVAEKGEDGALPEAEQKAYDNLKQKIARHKTGLDLSPLMALSDTWFGGNLASGYKAPLSEDERDLKLAGVELEEGKRGTELGIKNADRMAKFRKAVLDYKYKTDRDKKTDKYREADLAIKRARAGKGGKTDKPTVSGYPEIDLAVFKGGKSVQRVIDNHNKSGKPMSLSDAAILMGDAARNLEAKGKSREEAARSAFRMFTEEGLGPDAGKDEHEPNEGWLDIDLDDLNPFDNEDDD